MKETLKKIRAKSKDLYNLIRDYCAYSIMKIRTDRRRRLQAMIVAGVLLLLILLLCLLLIRPSGSGSKKKAEEKEEQETIQVMDITPPVQAMATPVPRVVDESASVSSGGITSVNEYLSRKNAG